MPSSAVNPQPLIAVRDVAASSCWYQRVLGCASGHGGDDYEQLMSGERMIMQLHRWEAHAHSHLGDANAARGNGVVLWFQIDAFDAALERIRTHGAKVLEGPLVNPNAGHREIWLADPDGYTVVIAGARGDLGDV